MENVGSLIRTAVKSIFKKKSFHQQIGLKFKGKTNEMLHLEHSFAWCWKGMEKISWAPHVKMKKCCVESRGKDHSTHNKKKKG